jgi:hypothetical protein
MNKIFQSVLIFLFIMFLAFAALQYNDPDPIVWIAIYGFAALASLLVLFNKINKYIILTSIFFYISAAAYIWPGTYEGITMPMSGHKPHIEEARESLGLLICSFSMCFLFFIARNRNIKTQNQEPVYK